MKIAAAQLNYKIGDFAGNFEKISQVMNDLAGKVDLIVFSELCLSGYYPRDLITHGNFLNEQNFYLNKLLKLSEETSTSIILGYIASDKKIGKRYYNSLGLISCGALLYTYHKRLLPVYNILMKHVISLPEKNRDYFLFKGASWDF